MRADMLAILPILFFSLLAQYARSQTFGESQLVHEWKWLDFTWSSEAEKQNATANRTFVPQRSLLSGIEVYKSDIYMSIPRRFESGVPVTLAKVVKVGGQTKLQPYPDWAAQKQGDCDALQFAQGIESDPNTGLLYVVDCGRVSATSSLCPAKIVVYDLNTNKRVGSYVLPDDVVNRTNNFLNDLVLDYVDGKVRYAYITDTNDQSIVVYDFQERSARKLRDSSMAVEGGDGVIVTINGIQYNFTVAVNGIAMSPDFQYVYYCVLGGYSLFQVPTSTLRNPRSTGDIKIRQVGRKQSQTDGMVHGRELLYYGAVGLNAVYFWNASADMASENANLSNVTLKTQMELFRNDTKMIWPNSLVLDGEGWLWIVCTSLQHFWQKGDRPTEAEAYMRVWKVFVNEKSYLDQADARTKLQNGGQTLLFSPLKIVVSVLASVFVAHCFRK
jgi:hypothetical protein